MKKTLILASVVTAVLGLLVVGNSVSAKAFSSTNSATTSTSTISIRANKVAKLEATSARLQKRADQEIDRRIESLGKLQIKIQDMKKVSSSSESSLSATIEGQINLLNNLKTKIGADTDSATLKTDVQSVTKAYRIYALILPQISVLAAADRLSSTTSMLSDYVAKLQVRITALGTTGKDVTALQSLITDIQMKIADAKTQIQNAISGVNGLVPDNGDKTIAAKNLSALKDARNAIKAGTDDIKTGYKNALKIRNGLKNNGSVETSTSTATSTKRR